MSKKHRLVCIGDSLSQGFKSGAIFEPNLSYPATIAWEMGLGEDEFRYPSFAGQGGLPINIEYLLRRLDHEFGEDVNWWELPLLPIYLRQWMDEIEDYWETGAGAAPIRYRGAYHNLAVWGFQVQDAFLLTAGMCEQIASENSDDWVNQVPDNAMYRTALRVLIPSQSEVETDATQISRATELAASDGAENLLVFLGAEDEGSPGLEGIGGTVYVDADIDEDGLRRAWEETVQRSPVAQTLLRGVPLRFEVRPT